MPRRKTMKKKKGGMRRGRPQSPRRRNNSRSRSRPRSRSRSRPRSRSRSNSSSESSSETTTPPRFDPRAPWTGRRNVRQYRELPEPINYRREIEEIENEERRERRESREQNRGLLDMAEDAIMAEAGRNAVAAGNDLNEQLSKLAENVKGIIETHGPQVIDVTTNTIQTAMRTAQNTFDSVGTSPVGQGIQRIVEGAEQQRRRLGATAQKMINPSSKAPGYDEMVDRSWGL